jgi:CHAD domain-containing protein
MLLSPTPAAILDQQMKILRTQLEGVNDGRVDAVHDARVATRRIRELLALAPPGPGQDADENAGATYREVGRALGKVRDIDVQIALIRDLERHAPQTAPSMVVVRQDHERDRLAGMRRLIKTLERLDLEGMLSRTAHHPAGPRSRLAARAWRDHLRHLLVERARTAAERITHATGVYFPNRSHSARIAIKKLRYAAEISQATGASDLKRAIKTLHKGQEVLGEMHDRESLANTLARYIDREQISGEHIALTSQVLEGAVLDLHASYLERRGDLREACSEIERTALRGSKARPAIAVGGGLLVAGLAYLSNRAPQAAGKPLVEVKGRLAG